MAVNYVRLAAKATKLIKENGKQLTVTRVTGSVYDPITGKNVENKETFTTFAAQTEYSSSDIDGTLILQGDAKFVCIPGNEIKKGDVIVCDTGTWTVKEPNPKNPGGTVINYQVQARR